MQERSRINENIEKDKKNKCNKERMASLRRSRADSVK